jgi:Flp pilus assembly protein TadB
LTLVVLVILAALWAVVLLPPLLRSRTERSNDSIGDFEYRLDVLGRTNGTVHRGDSSRAPSTSRAAKRRRDVLRVLLISLGASGLLALATDFALLWGVFVLAVCALLGFFGLLVYARALQADRALKVRELPPSPHTQRDLALRRAAGS